jgi:hypothetical protein
MTKKVFALDTKSGIQRDGTILDKLYYQDGEWVRFQRGRPRKIGGYREMTNQMIGLSRGIFVESEDGYNRIFNGYNNGLERFECDNDGIGAGITEYDMNGGPILTTGTLVGGSLYTNGTYTTVTLTGGSGSGAKATIVVSGAAVTSVTITTEGNGYVVGDTLSAAAASIGGTGSGFSVNVATVDSDFVASDFNLWQFDGFFDATGSGNNLLLAHPGQNLAQIDNTTATAVLAGAPGGDVMYPLKDTAGTSPSGDTISVAGGVVALHPYVFVYGDNGLIKNCSAGNVFDWNSADSNETNVSSQKIVKGLPVRGGSNAPSGLFWALDSLIRVSYAPTTVGAQQLYWRYDIVGSSTILSSQSVIEYDGIYYWCGVDRFLLYNGVIKELPNEFNQNYFFDNLNYNQRQKVWATKVTRFGEVWWFFPNGDSEECNDAIIYNIRENCWYDLGTAVGARRTAGYASQVFRFPVMAGEDLTVEETILTQDIDTTNGSDVIVTEISNQLYVGMIVVATGVPSGTTILEIVASATPGYYDITLSVNCTATATVSAEFNSVPNRISLWQHETGVNEVKGQNISAIRSSFETNDLGIVTGGPSQASMVGDNFWLHLERMEPDFLQQGDMELYVTGRPFAQKADKTTGPYPFSPTDGKVDLREQRRELRLIFVSDVQDGDYQLGRIMLSADVGDVRPY